MTALLSYTQSGSTISLYGTPTTAQIAAFLGQGYTINLYGVLTNTAATLNLGTGANQTVIVLEPGGTITGGTITDSGSGLVSNGGELSGVTYQGALNVGSGEVDLVSAFSATTTTGGAGSITVADNGVLYATTTATSVDSATVTLSGQNSSIDAAAALNLGSNLVVNVTGQGDAIAGSNLASAVTNSGAINVQGTGSSLNISSTAFTNAVTTGKINVASGDTLNVLSTGFTNNGVVAVNGGSVYLASLAGSGEIDLAANSTLKVNGPVTGTNAIKVSGSGVKIEIGSSTTGFGAADPISGLVAGDTLVVDNQKITSAVYTVGATQNTGTLTLYNGTTQIGSLALAGGYYASSDFSVTYDGTSSTVTVANGPRLIGASFTDTGNPTDSITSNTTITGYATPGATVTLTIDGAVITPTTPITANANGSWSYNTATGSATQLADGAHTIVASQSGTGVIPASTPAVTYTLETSVTAPGFTTSSLVNSTATQIVTGTGEAGSTVTVSVTGNDGANPNPNPVTVPLGTAVVGSDGTWSLSVNLTQANVTSIGTITAASLQLSASATDVAGNSNAANGQPATGTQSISLVSAPTSALTITPPLNAATNQATQTISGTGGTVGSTVTLYDNGTQIGTATVTAGTPNAWTTNVTLSGQGAHNITAATASTVNGSTTTITSAPVTYTLDTVAPTVTLTSTGGLTNNTTQTFTGTGEAGTTVKLYDAVAGSGQPTSSTPIATATVRSDGTWSTVGTLNSANGVQRVYAVDQDAAGNIGISGTATYTLDVATPTVTINPPGISANGHNYVDNGTPTFTGTGEVGSTVTLYDNGVKIGTATVNQYGNWSTTATVSGQGNHSLTASAIDAAGNTYTTPTPVTYIFDTIAPAVAITSAGGAATTAVQTIAGTGEAGTTVKIYDNGAQVGTASVGTNGTWSAGVKLLGDGAHSITASDTDVAGNIGISASVSYTLNTGAPTVSITSTGGLTNQTSQTITGTTTLGNAGQTVYIYDTVGTNSPRQLGSATVKADGTWSVSVTLSGDGTHSLSARVGNTSGSLGVSTGLTYTLDTTPPAVAITSTGGAVTQATQTIAGTGEAGTTVKIYDNNAQVGTTTVGTNGTWSSSVTLSGGSNSFTALDTDAAGNIGSSTAVTYTLNASVAITSVGGLTNQPSQTISGTTTGLAAGSSVTLFDGTTSLGTATVGSNGAWSATVTLSGNGAHNIKAAYTNGNGNILAASPTVTYTLDTIAPAVAITSTGGTVTQAAQVISGTGEAGTTVNVLDNGTKISTATVGANGTWSSSVTLSGGSNSITATDTDAAGNVGTSTAVTYTLGSVESVAITSTGGLTNKAAQTISGTTTGATAGSLVALFDGTTSIGTATVGTNGTWSVNATLSGDGAHNIKATLIDASTGNVSSSTPVTYTLDTVVPTVAITSTGGLTNKAAQTVSGTTTGVAAGTLVALFDGTTLIGTTTVGSNGTWSANVTLSSGANSITASLYSTTGLLGTSAPVTYTLASASTVTVAQFLANQATLDQGSIVIADTAANVVSALDTISADTHVSSITLTDTGTPTLTLTAAKALSDAAGLAKIASSHTVTISDTTTAIQALSATQIASLSAVDVTNIVASNAGVTLTAAQATALEAAKIVVSAPKGSTVSVSDTAANLQSLSTGAGGQIQSLSGIGVTSLKATDANVTFNAAQTSDLQTAKVSVSAAGTQTVTESFAKGSTITFSSDGSGGQIFTLGTTGQSVIVGGSAMTVSDGSQTLSLTKTSTNSFDATNSTGASDTFTFLPYSGNETITGFVASGTNHDNLKFTAAAFGMTSASSQANDFAALLANTSQNAAGSAVIKDIYGDTVTLNGVSKTALASAASDFKFS